MNLHHPPDTAADVCETCQSIGCRHASSPPQRICKTCQERHVPELHEENRTLRVQTEQQAALIDELGDLIETIWRDTGHGVFAPGPEGTQALATAREKAKRQ